MVFCDSKASGSPLACIASPLAKKSSVTDSPKIHRYLARAVTEEQDSDGDYDGSFDTDDEEANLNESGDSTFSSHIGALQELGEQIRWAEDGLNDLSCQWDSTVNDLMNWSTAPSAESTIPPEGEGIMAMAAGEEAAEEQTGLFSFSLGWDKEKDSKQGSTTDSDFDDEVQLLMIPKRLSVFLGWESEDSPPEETTGEEQGEDAEEEEDIEWIGEDITLQEIDLAQEQQEEEEEEEKTERRPVKEENGWMEWFAGGAAPCNAPCDISRPKSD
jgi:hypothetical protein